MSYFVPYICISDDEPVPEHKARNPSYSSAITFQDVVTHYYDRHYDTVHKNFLTPPSVPTAQKKNVVAYINRNCGAKNGRNDIVKELSKYFPVEGYGCLGSMDRVNKTKVFSRSKVKVTFVSLI
jgi:hypothetical protein